MTRRDDQRAEVAQFGEDQAAGIGQVVGVADMENVSFAIQIADGGDKFGARRTAVIRRSIFSLSVKHVVVSPEVCFEHRNQRQAYEKYRESHKAPVLAVAVSGFPACLLDPFHLNCLKTPYRYAHLIHLAQFQ